MHTPGPWLAEDHGEVETHRGRMVTIRDKRNVHLATIDGLDASVRGQELANARLIASAPALLEALEAAIVKIEACTRGDCANVGFHMENARKAIKEAK